MTASGAIAGSGGNDVIDGSADPDEMSGLEGDDHLYGHDGDDTLFGNDGNDTLEGGRGDDHLDGGSGDDTLNGGEGADTIVFRDGYGHDVIMDFDPGEDRVQLDASGVETWEDVKARLGADPDGTAVLRLDDGSTLRFDGVTPDRLTEANFDLAAPPICFAAGTRIATPGGGVLVEDLSVGDRVTTLDHGPQTILWIGRRRTVFGHGDHRHRPVRIAAGAMGRGLPEADLRVSPQHRILVPGPEGRRFLAGALAKAKGLCGRRGIAQETDGGSVDYIQILLARHEIVLANGLPAETFLPRAFALRSLGADDRDVLAALLPGILDDPRAGYGRPARPLLSMDLLAALPDAALRSVASCGRSLVPPAPRVAGRQGSGSLSIRTEMHP